MGSNNKYPYESYLHIRSRLETQSNDASNRFDTTLITLSVSALGASMLFLTTMKPSNLLCLLGISWGCLVIAIGVTLYSYKLSEDYLRMSIESLDLDFRNKDTTQIDRRISKYSTIMDCLRLIGIIGLILGIIFLGLFLFVNV